MRKPSKKAVDAAVSAAFYKVANGVQIPIMKLGAIHEAGRQAFLAGGDVEAAVKTAVDAVRAN